MVPLGGCKLPPPGNHEEQDEVLVRRLQTRRRHPEEAVSPPLENEGRRPVSRDLRRVVKHVRAEARAAAGRPVGSLRHRRRAALGICAGAAAPMLQHHRRRHPQADFPPRPAKAVIQHHRGQPG